MKEIPTTKVSWKGGVERVHLQVIFVMGHCFGVGASHSGHKVEQTSLVNADETTNAVMHTVPSIRLTGPSRLKINCKIQSRKI